MRRPGTIKTGAQSMRVELVILRICFPSPLSCRLSEIKLNLDPEGPGLGISIVGGGGSPNGDLPIIIKRVLPDCIAERDGRLKSGDELIAVNDTRYKKLRLLPHLNSVLCVAFLEGVSLKINCSRHQSNSHHHKQPHAPLTQVAGRLSSTI